MGAVLVQNKVFADLRRSPRSQIKILADWELGDSDVIQKISPYHRPALVTPTGLRGLHVGGRVKPIKASNYQAQARVRPPTRSCCRGTAIQGLTMDKCCGSPFSVTLRFNVIPPFLPLKHCFSVPHTLTRLIISTVNFITKGNIADIEDVNQ